jgi:hypothetical protein
MQVYAGPMCHYRNILMLWLEGLHLTSYKEFMMLDIASAVAAFSFSVDL